MSNTHYKNDIKPHLGNHFLGVYWQKKRYSDKKILFFFLLLFIN